jgi:putative redox protein
LGGAASLIAADNLVSVKAVATIGAPYDPEHVANLFQTKMDEIKEKGEAKVELAGRSFTIKKQFLDDIEEQKVIHRLENLKKAILILHSPQDDIVGIENARQLYEHAMHPKSFISLDGADHLLSSTRDARYSGIVIANWASRYLKVPHEDKQVETDKQVVVELCKDDKFTTEVQAGNHHFLADEPKSAGGDDLGPTPYELLNAGLGTCTAMTLHMYARRKEWNLESVRVHLEHNKTHKKDSDEGGKLDEFIREIELEGELDNDQRERLLEIANKCPVHKTMSRGVRVKSELLTKSK